MGSPGSFGRRMIKGRSGSLCPWTASVLISGKTSNVCCQLFGCHLLWCSRGRAGGGGGGRGFSFLVRAILAKVAQFLASEAKTLLH